MIIFTKKKVYLICLSVYDQLPTPETTDASQQGPLSVLEVSDPKICILAHLMSPLEPIEPLLESPLAHPLSKQRAVASELLNEVQQGNNAVGGMLLANMERSSGEFQGGVLSSSLIIFLIV